MKNIHPTALIHKNSEIANDVEIGPYVVIEEHVKIGAGNYYTITCSNPQVHNIG